VDIAHGEKVEAELDHMIRRRDEGERLEEELWKASVERYNARQEAEMRAQWYGWHCDQAERHRRTLETLIAHHEEQAERLCEENGNGHRGEGVR
jgi:hypothetical protein